MFCNKTAWFSRSVPQECKRFWTIEGGRSTCWKSADYLFSRDASCPDTKRIYSSKDYLFNKVTIFHCNFLSACEKRQSFRSVCLGDYVLPPEPVQEEVRHIIGRFIWECDDVSQPDSYSDKSGDILSSQEEGQINPPEPDSSVNGQLCDALGECPSNNTNTGYLCMDNLLKKTCPLSDFNPRCFRRWASSSHCRVPQHIKYNHNCTE